MKKTVVEFCGMPGSGKSSLVEAYKKSSKRVVLLREDVQHYPVYGQRFYLSKKAFLTLFGKKLRRLYFEKQSFDFLSQALNENRDCLRLLDEMLTLFPKEWRNRVTQLTLYDLVYTEAYKHIDSESPLILDEGLQQRLLTSIMSKENERHIVQPLFTGFWKANLLPDLIIYVSVSYDLMMERLKNRRRGFPKRLPEAVFDQTLYDIFQHNFDWMKSFYDEFGIPVKVLSSSESSIDELVREIDDFIGMSLCKLT